jgi:hypothetical protein
MNYSFLTSESFRIDATAKNPKQAYKIAQQKLSAINTQNMIKHIRNKNYIDFGELTGTYFKYDRDGTHAVDGAYYQI